MILLISNSGTVNHTALTDAYRTNRWVLLGVASMIQLVLFWTKKKQVVVHS